VLDLRGGDHWTLRDIHTRLDRGNAPWEGYAKAARSPNAAMKMLGFDAKKAGGRGR
jgi:bifunctional non-homologous end joining protein LigD